MSYAIRATDSIYTDTIWYAWTIDDNSGTFDWTTNRGWALRFNSATDAVTALAQRIVEKSREHQARFVFSIVVFEEDAAPKKSAKDLSTQRTEAEIDHLRSIARLNNSMAELNESEARKLKVERRQNDV